MANTTVLIRKSGTGGNQPSSLEFGELALNYADGKLFFKRANNYIQSIDLNFTATSNATSNIAIIQGIDDWQNTRITAIDSYAGGAYAQANTNSNNITIIQGVDTTQNTNISAANNLAQGAFDKANSANVLAQAAFNTANTKYASSGGEISGDVTITGNLVVQGTQFTTSAQTLTIADNMIYLNNAISANISNAVGNGTYAVYTTTINHNYAVGYYVMVTGITPSSLNISGASNTLITSVTANTFTVASSVTDSYVSGGVARAKTASNPDLGFAAGYNDGTYHHTGLFRDATDGTWKFFYNYTPEPDESIYIDTNHSSFRIANLTANLITDVATIRGFDPIDRANAAFDKANSANVLAQASFDTANSASSNTVYTQGVDLTQNTRITAVDTYAGGAYAQANTNATNITAIQGVDLTQNTNITNADTKAQAAFDKANNTTSYVQGIDDSQNTRITAVDTYAGGAYAKANTNASDITVIQGVDLTQNTRITAVDTYASGAYAQANTNTSDITIIQGVNTTQNTNITNVDTKAQAAFDKANTGGEYAIDNVARLTANSASSNTVILQGVNDNQNTRITAVDTYAGGAYAKANTNATDITIIQGVNTTQNTRIDAVNNYSFSAYAQANTNAANIALIQGVNSSQNTRLDAINNYSFGAYAQANLAYAVASDALSVWTPTDQKAQAAFDKANSASSNTIITQGVDVWQNTRIIAVDAFAGAAYNKANDALASSGGSISGDLVVSGNLTVIGQQVYANTQTVLIKDNIVTLNAAIGQASAPTANAGLEIDRGSSANVYLLWNENSDVWQFTNDGTNYYTIADTTTLGAAFNAANTAASNTVYTQGVDTTQNTRITAVDSYASGAYAQANAANNLAQSAFNKANTAAADITVIQGVDTTQNTRIQAAFDKANNASPMLKVASINSSNVYSNIVSNVSTIAFDSFTGFHVDDMGEGNVKISLGSTFSTWNIVGQSNLNAVGDDIIRINGANGIVITTNPSDSPYKSITFNGNTIYDKANAAATLAQAAFDQANTGGGGVVSLGGFAANNVLTVNSAGYIANNANLNYYTSNNTLVVTGNVVGGGIRSTSSSSAPANPVVGDIWYKTTTDVLYRYTSDGTSAYWLDITGSSVRLDTGVISGGGIKVTDTFIATANQTVFTTSQGYDANSLDVFYNGVKLIKDTDFVASDGLTITLTSPATAGAYVQLVAWSSPINILSPFLLMGA
jgi:hypothetical protein